MNYATWPEVVPFLRKKPHGVVVVLISFSRFLLNHTSSIFPTIIFVLHVVFKCVFVSCSNAYLLLLTGGLQDHGAEVPINRAVLEVDTDRDHDINLDQEADSLASLQAP